MLRKKIYETDIKRKEERLYINTYICDLFSFFY